VAEMTGPDAVAWDRFARQAMLTDTARACFEALDTVTRRWCTRYVDGVNQALAEGRRGGAEFTESGTEPGPWSPWMPLAVFLVNHILFSTFPHKLFREHVSDVLGPEAVALFSQEAPVLSGSNAWAVHGSRTAGGAPILAGDPHRLLEIPGVYQQVRLSCPEFDVVGLAFPGVPGLPHFGHAGGVAWAITNSMADYQDLFREKLRRSGPTGLEAFGPGGWEAVTTRTEELLVRGEDAVTVEIGETERGPVIAGLPGPGEGDLSAGLSLRTPARVTSRLGFEALLPLLRSSRASDVEQALDAWVEPVNSVLVADTRGEVRHLLAGKVPLRSPENRVMPVPAWSAAHRWEGTFLPLPSRAVDTVAVSANDRAAALGADIALEFAPAHRALRIAELLHANDDGPHPLLCPEDMGRIHTDTRLGSLSSFRPLLAGLARDSLSDAARRALDELLAWDGHMDMDSEPAAVFALWRDALVHRLAAHPVFEPLQAPTGHAPVFAPWLALTGRLGLALETLVACPVPDGLDLPREAAAALEAVLPVSLADGAGAPSWGELHRLHPLHRLPAAAAASLPSTPLAGDSSCVLATDSVPGGGHLCFRGSAARYVWDLSDRRNSRWIVPFGTAGSPAGPHFLDQLPLWAAGELLPVITDWDRLTLGDLMPGTTIHQTPEPSAPTSAAATDRSPGRIRILPVRPEEDGDLIHSWVSQERARFWGMTEYTRDEVVEVYRFLDSLPTHHAFLLTLEEEPVALFQSYDPFHDPVGEAYEPQNGDLGIHLFMAPARQPRPGLTPRLVLHFIGHLFATTGARRIVVEPDVRNAKALARLAGSGFEPGPVIELPDKQAQLFYLRREVFERLPALDDAQA